VSVEQDVKDLLRARSAVATDLLLRIRMGEVIPQERINQAVLSLGDATHEALLLVAREVDRVKGS
jgi:hypothetical protein